MIISAIAAMTEERVIGRDNGLPWKIPEDLKYFKDKTMGKTIIMGRRTFASMGKALPGRLNIVVSRNPMLKIERVQVVNSVEAAIELCRANPALQDSEIFIIGGAEIYKLALPYLDKIYLTIIHAHFSGDVYFPTFSPDHFELADKSPVQKTIGVGKEQFTFLTYQRIAAETALEGAPTHTTGSIPIPPSLAASRPKS